MKKIKLFYNPFSGDNGILKSLDAIIEVFHEAGYETHMARGSNLGDIEAAARSMERYDAAAVAGGDGTLNTVVNSLLKYGYDIPVGIIPAGTANDFASFLKIPTDARGAARVIAGGKTLSCDVGFAKGLATGKSMYFINVCAAGFLTNVSKKIDGEMKNALGKFAYYIEALGQLKSFAPLPMKITNSKETFTEDLYLFVVLNSSGTGGFREIIPDASAFDGLFDFVAVKARPFVETTALLVKILKRNFLNDPNIIYFRDSYIKAEPLYEKNEYYETDADGEVGPEMPVEIKNVGGAVKIFVP